MNRTTASSASIKPSCGIIIVVLFLLTYFLLVGNTIAAKDKIRMVTDEWSPFTTRLSDKQSSGEGGGYGLVAEIVTAVLRDMQLQPMYQFRPWEKIEDLIRNGEFRYSFPYRKTPSREKEFEFSEPLLTVNGVLYYNIKKIPDASKIKTVSDLIPYTFGFIKGFGYSKTLRDAINRKLIVENARDAFKKLVDGKIDVLPFEHLAGEIVLKRFHWGKQHTISRLPHFKYPNTLHLIALKGDSQAEEFITQFNNSLLKIENDGILHELMRRYRVKSDDWPEVRLIGPGNFPLAIGTIESNAEKGYLIPRGTRAVVIEWNSLFKEESDFDIKKDLYEKTQNPGRS